MTKLTALTPINHDGVDVAEGATFDVADEKQISQLVDCGAAAVKGRKSKAQEAAEVAQAAADAAAQADEQAIADAAAAAAAAVETPVV